MFTYLQNLMSTRFQNLILTLQTPHIYEIWFNQIQIFHSIPSTPPTLHIFPKWPPPMNTNQANYYGSVQQLSTNQYCYFFYYEN
jgi:hypothetical protein